MFWHPKGWTLWQQVEQYMRAVYRDNGYQEVKGPQILDKALWEKTGHWDKYRDNMFTTESEKRDYALKPMNCPGHILIFKQGIKSYRDLPLRYGEFGQCHRNEPTRRAARHHARARLHAGRRPHLLHRGPDPRPSAWPTRRCCRRSTRDFGFTDIIYKVATRPEARIGTDEAWDKAEHALMDGLRRSGCEFEIVAGRGRLLRPEDRVHAEGRDRPPVAVRHDAGRLQHGRAAGRRVRGRGRRAAQRPVMLHRAIVGSLERFIGILIEQHAGALPAWLAPLQVVVAPITEDQADYAAERRENASKTRS